jgi:hypothetical protein
LPLLFQIHSSAILEDPEQRSFPLGLLTDAYGTNIEYLFTEHKSIMAEEAYLSGITTLAFLGKNKGSLGSLHFRHWFGQGFGSPFIGVFMKYANIETLSLLAGLDSELGFGYCF